MNAIAEYGFSDRASGSGHSSGNGHSTGAPSPAQKAWQTAKDRAVAEAEQRQVENQRRGETERLEMIRALTDVNLSDGAARLFCLLLKAGWMKDFGGLYRDRVGSVMIDGRRLARLCGGASVNRFYRKLRKEKRDPKTGELLQRASETDGWLNELVRGGYIWITKHRIPNIPPAKWPNVYNVACHVPQQITPHLPWSDGNFGSENVVVEGCSPGENSLFDASNTPGHSERAENTNATHRNGSHPVTAAAHRQVGEGMIANHRNGGQASTTSANGQMGEGMTGKHRNGAQPVTDSDNGQCADAVHLRETLDKKQLLDSQTGKAPAPKSGFEEDDLIVPKFPSIPADIFESKLRQQLKDAEAKLRRIKTYHSTTEKTPGENILWLQAEAEKAEPKLAKQLRAKLEKLKRNPDAYVKRLVIKPEAQPAIDAWTNRVAEIKGKLARGEYV